MLAANQGFDRSEASAPTVALVGAGFVGRGIAHRLLRGGRSRGLLMSNRDTERALAALSDAGAARADVVISDDAERLGEALHEGRTALTADASVLPEVPGIDVVVEATGALEFGASVILGNLERGRHVVSMNAELDALIGHELDAVARRHGATYSIGDGDQPGVLLRIMDEALALGLQPVVALNCKRNLNVHQSLAESRPFATRDGTSVHMTTAFGDGTKMHIENVVTANLCGLTPLPLGTEGIRTCIADVANDVREAGVPEGRVHFTLGGDFGGGVVVLAVPQDPSFDSPYLRYGKLGDGPWYPLFRPYHLIHMEVPSTIQQIAAGGPALGRRTPHPVAACVAVSKQALGTGTTLDGIGGDGAYGVALASSEAQGLLDVGLTAYATVVRELPVDTPIRLEDVELDEEADLVRLYRRATSNGHTVAGLKTEVAGA